MIYAKISYELILQKKFTESIIILNVGKALVNHPKHNYVSVNVHVTYVLLAKCQLGFILNDLLVNQMLGYSRNALYALNLISTLYYVLIMKYRGHYTIYVNEVKEIYCHIRMSFNCLWHWWLLLKLEIWIYLCLSFDIEVICWCFGPLKCVMSKIWLLLLLLLFVFFFGNISATDVYRED